MIIRTTVIMPRGSELPVPGGNWVRLGRPWGSLPKYREGGVLQTCLHPSLSREGSYRRQPGAGGRSCPVERPFACWALSGPCYGCRRRTLGPRWPLLRMKAAANWATLVPGFSGYLGSDSQGQSTQPSARPLDWTGPC
jgi:hypothetical protein